MATDKIQTGLRLTESTYKKLKRIAKDEKRTFNNLVEYIVEEYIKMYETQNGPVDVSDM